MCRVFCYFYDMKTITGEEFRSSLYRLETDTISYHTVIINRICIVDLNRVKSDLSFENISFEGGNLRFTNGEEYSTAGPSLSFDTCQFNCILTFSKARIQNLSFENGEFANNNIYIKNCQIQDFTSNSLIVEGLEFSIRRSKINYFDFENITIINGVFKMWDCQFSEFFLFTQSSLKNYEISHCKFEKYFDFISNKSFNNSIQTFRYCIFGKSSFFGNQFSSNAIYHNCSFLDVVNFQDIGNRMSKLKFSECVFEKYVQFNGAILNTISLDNVKFNEIVSFQEIFIKQFEIDKTLFEKNALFDDIQIKEIDKCNRRTLRNIKQQLQKAENKIDYNRFRAYELAAYYNELKWFGNFKDKFILGATKVATGFDHSWRRALVFTLLIGFSLYALFFVSENYMLQRDFSQWQEFLSGYFRFLIVTDFYNPLAEGRTYIDNTNTIGWLIFIFGKIVIAFGIYEMIQAFRKFKP